MKKFDFNYYIERAEVLNEMARPSKLLSGEGGSKMSEYIKKVSSVMKTGGEIQEPDIKTGETATERVPGYAGNPQDRVFKFIINTILDFEGMDIRFGEEETRQTLTGLTKVGAGKEPLVDGAMKLLGISGQTLAATGMTTGDLFRKAIAKWTTENQDKVLSPEFQKEITDPQNILFFLKNKRSSPHTTGKVKDEKLQSLHGGKSVEDIHDMSQKIHPLITKIHRLQAYKQRKKQPNAPVEEVEGEDTVVNQDTHNITMILYNLEAYIALKKVIDGILGANFENVNHFNISDLDKIQTINDQLPTPLPESALMSLASLQRGKDGNTLLEDMFEEFEEYLEDGLSFEDFQTQMEDYASFSPQTSLPIINFLSSNLIENVQTSSDFPGYDPEILQQVLGDDPENWEAFSQYYEWKESEKYRTESERKSRKSLRSDMGSYDDYRGMLPELRRNYQLFFQKWNEINKQKSKRYAQSLQVDDEGNYINQDDDSNMDERQLLAKKIAELEDVDDDDYIAGRVAKAKTRNESYIMNYMTEQVSKDRFKPRGEFKDRGFRKMNYLEWMERNS